MLLEKLIFFTLSLFVGKTTLYAAEPTTPVTTAYEHNALNRILNEQPKSTEACAMTMHPKPNLQLIYVSDIKRSTEFYKTLFNTEPVFESPRYVAFVAGKDAIFALWTGGIVPDATAPRFSEIGIMMSSNEEVDLLFEEWKKIADIKILQEPQTEIFGRTFLVQDPDGHVVRVCPVG